MLGIDSTKTVVRVQGIIVYSTCTIAVVENQDMLTPRCLGKQRLY